MNLSTKFVLIFLHFCRPIRPANRFLTAGYPHNTPLLVQHDFEPCSLPINCRAHQQRDPKHEINATTLVPLPAVPTTFPTRLSTNAETRLPRGRVDVR
jgi:hypothetical protein